MQQGSNYSLLVDDKKQDLTPKCPVFRQSAYRELFQEALSYNELAEIRECTHKCWALGGERFKEQIEALGQRRAVSKSVGFQRRIIIVSDSINFKVAEHLGIETYSDSTEVGEL